MLQLVPMLLVWFHDMMLHKRIYTFIFHFAPPSSNPALEIHTLVFPCFNAPHKKTGSDELIQVLEQKTLNYAVSREFLDQDWETFIRNGWCVAKRYCLIRRRHLECRDVSQNQWTGEVHSITRSLCASY